MTAALEQNTVFPPEKPDARLAELTLLLASDLPDQRAKLVGPDGTTSSLPDEMYRVLRAVVDAMSKGFAITIAPHNTLLTTQEAADILSISRPTLVRLLEDGEIPFEKRGRHRRVRLADVVGYQQQARARRRETLDDMTRAATEDGTYDQVDGFVETR
ncbi:MAG: helix-turn-helix domain-containing protein [Umezawaea sp.]